MYYIIQYTIIYNIHDIFNTKINLHILLTVKILRSKLIFIKQTIKHILYYIR